MAEAIPQKAGIRAFWLVAIELGLAFLAGLSLIALGAGEGSWILGGIVAGAIVYYFCRLSSHQPLEPNRNARKLGQILIGLTVGCSVQVNSLAHLPTQLPIFALLTAFLLLSSGAIGYLYARLEKTDLLTALLASVPGNIGIMASVAADYGKNTSLVSLVQLIRFTAVTLVIPIVANVDNTRDVKPILYSLANDLMTIDRRNILLLGLVLATTFLAVTLGTQLKIPVATFFCPIVVGIVLNGLFTQLPTIDFTLPILLKVAGQILLGLTIGEYWGSSPKPKGSTIACASVPVGLVLLAGFGSAAVAKLLTSWDWLTCLLVTAPGGSPEMIWIALALDHDVEIVTAGHLIRLLAINLSLPLLVSLGGYLDRFGDRNSEDLEPQI